MLMRYDPMDTGYARLIDFSNSTQDTGIYKLGNGVSFYPVGTFASGSFVQDQDVFVTITRDAGTQLVSLYINGVASGTYTDTTNLYAPSATVVYFLMDNTTGYAAIRETDPGTIAYLQVRDTPITPGGGGEPRDDLPGRLRVDDDDHDGAPDHDDAAPDHDHDAAADHDDDPAAAGLRRHAAGRDVRLDPVPARCPRRARS